MIFYFRKQNVGIIFFFEKLIIIDFFTFRSKKVMLLKMREGIGDLLGGLGEIGL